FAFSIFWTYIWFSQFLLIYYANVPEETVYFIQRMSTSPYSWIFYVNLLMNFILPFLLFMTRDAKRHMSILKLVTPIVLVGHWFDFYMMINPGVLKDAAGVGFMEIGMTLIYGSAFIFVMLTALSKMPLVAKNHPMLQESMHHHI
ncbi:MAG: quinol:cytochrome C oxidoreductase, partial [Cyclobacteriaceae bacterium]|nr:quinol:cytochrome C oxidoreductase [Cyclobacteriaceae bacterium]